MSGTDTLDPLKVDAALAGAEATVGQLSVLLACDDGNNISGAPDPVTGGHPTLRRPDATR